MNTDDLEQRIAAERARLARELVSSLWTAIAPHVSAALPAEDTGYLLPGSCLVVPVRGEGRAAALTVADTGVRVADVEALLDVRAIAEVTWRDETDAIIGNVSAAGFGAVALLRRLARFLTEDWPPLGVLDAGGGHRVVVQPPVGDAARIDWHARRGSADDPQLDGELTVRPREDDDWHATALEALAFPPALSADDLVAGYERHWRPGTCAARWTAAAGPYELDLSVTPLAPAC